MVFLSFWITVDYFERCGESFTNFLLLHDILELLNVIFLEKHIHTFSHYLVGCWKVLLYCFVSHFIPLEAWFFGFMNGKCEMLLNPGLKSMKLQELWSVEKGCEIVARSRAADVVAVCDVFVCPLWVFWTWLAIQCLA